jgi:chaperonin cofactor prefoldin
MTSGANQDLRKQELREKVDRLMIRVEEWRKWRAESDKRLERIIAELRELARSS